MATPEPSIAPSTPGLTGWTPGSRGRSPSRRRTAVRRAATTGAPTPSAGGVSFVVEQLPARPGTRFSTSVAAPGCAAAAAAQGRPLGDDHRDRRLCPDARGRRHPGRRVRLGQRAPARRPGRAGADRPHRRRRLFCAVHDVLQSTAALTNVFEHLRSGAAVAATGGKWPPTLERGAARVGGRSARTVHQRLRSAAVAAAGRVCPRPAGDRAGLRRWIPGGRPRSWPARHHPAVKVEQRQ